MLSLACRPTASEDTKQARFSHETGSTPEQMGLCSEASHSSCQLRNLLFTALWLSVPEDTLDRVFYISIAKKKNKYHFRETSTPWKRRYYFLLVAKKSPSNLIN